MNVKKKIKLGFLITVGCYALMSLAILLLPFVNSGGTAGQDILQYVIGILFWAGLLAGSVFYIFLYRKYKNRIVTELPDGRVPAFLRFFSSPAAAATDLALILGIGGMVYCSLAEKPAEGLELASMFLLVTSLYLHFLVNGKIFRYISQSKKRGVKER